MRKRSKVAVAVGGALLGLATIAAIVSSVASSYREMCEVCMTFNGQTVCREAYGKSRPEAIETATDNACGLLARGMTASIQCGKTEPVSVTCSP